MRFLFRLRTTKLLVRHNPLQADRALAFWQLCRIVSWDLSGIFREPEDELLRFPIRSSHTRVPGSELPPKLTAPLKLLTLQIASVWVSVPRAPLPPGCVPSLLRSRGRDRRL